MGAGTVYLNRDIETEKLSVEMGAGEFESKNPVTAREADLEIGTGRQMENVVWVNWI